MSDLIDLVLKAGIPLTSVQKVVEVLKKLGVNDANDLYVLKEEDYKDTG